MNAPSVERLVQQSVAAQRTVNRVPVGIALVFGVGILLLAIFVPAKAGEEAAKWIMTGAAIASIVGGLLYARISSARLARFAELVLRDKSQVREPTLIHLRRRGVTHYQVRIRDAGGTTYRVTMPSERAAVSVLESLRQ